MLRLYVCCSRLELQSSFLTRLRDSHALLSLHIFALLHSFVSLIIEVEDSTTLGFIQRTWSSSGTTTREWC